MRISVSLPFPVPPPQRPLPRRSRSAARRIAGTPSRSRQPTGDPRPPVPGKVQEGAEAPSWFPPPPAAERSQIIFRRGMYVTKNPSHAATCKTEAAPSGAASVLHPSGVQKEAASGIAGGSFLPSCQRLSDAGTGPFLAGMFLGTFRRNIFMPCGRSPGRPRSCGPPCP